MWAGCLKMWDPQRLTALRASMACTGIALHLSDLYHTERHHISANVQCKRATWLPRYAVYHRVILTFTICVWDCENNGQCHILKNMSIEHRCILAQGHTTNKYEYIHCVWSSLLCLSCSNWRKVTVNINSLMPQTILVPRNGEGEEAP
jgi:hypothetical protein